jgi:hypothetical protein
MTEVAARGRSVCGFDRYRRRRSCLTRRSSAKKKPRRSVTARRVISRSAVLSCAGFDQPHLASCRLINDWQAERDHPAASSGLRICRRSIRRGPRRSSKRCAVKFGFTGVVIASELQGQALTLRPILEGVRRFSGFTSSSTPGRGPSPCRRCMKTTLDYARLGILAQRGDRAADQQWFPHMPTSRSIADLFSRQ